MNKLFFCTFIFVSTLSFGNASAQTTASQELIRNAAFYDGKTVIYEGEVIGDIMKRGAESWINVHDGVNAIGVLIGSDDASRITHVGGYQTKGDWIEVSGTFNKACPHHGGDLDIHASSVRIVTVGTLRREAVSPEKKKIAYILAGVLCLVMILSLLTKK